MAGFIEVKAPGKGFDPRRFTDDHDKKQWQKLKTLPNLIYTDGNGFTLWQDGELKASVALDGDIEKSGAKLAAPATLLGLFADFLAWEPIAPRSAKQLAGIAARLCRLLREEVAEELDRNNPGLASLSSEWRNLLFPEATNKQFADGYAQAVTFGLLVARVRKIDLADGLDHAATELRKVSGLIGTALRLLVDDQNVKTALKSALDTLRRVLNVVDWELVSKGDADAWLYFYEDFLEVYDNDLRKQTGSYYTPPQVVDAMVRLVDEALRDKALFKKRDGLAAKDVYICDPAVGTGTYLLGVLRQIARSVEADKGAGAVAAEVEKAAERMFAFEMQFGPFAVAQLRLIAEMQALVGGLIPPIPNLYITDTLGDPYAAETQFSSMVETIAASRKEANRIKREQPITVVIGNPPYKEKAQGARRLDRRAAGCGSPARTPVGRGNTGADGPVVAAGWLGRWRARQASEEPLRLFLAVGDVEGFWLGSSRGGRRQQGRLRHYLLHHRRRLFEWSRLPEDARGIAARLRGDLGRRLLAGRAPAGGQHAPLSRRAAASVHRARRANAGQGSRQASEAEVHGAAARAPRACEVRGAGADDAQGWRIGCEGPNDWRAPFSAGAGRRVGKVAAAGKCVRLQRLRRDARSRLGSLRRMWDRLANVGLD